MKLSSVIALLTLCLGVAQASDLIGTYCLIDKVVLEPSADHPQRVQIWGVFAMSKPQEQRKDFNDDYLPPQRGYLYFSIPSDPTQAQLALKEWNDLKNVAGKRQVMSFGGRNQFRMLRVHPADEKPSLPDPYILEAGANPLRSDRVYGPIQSLLDFK